MIKTKTMITKHKNPIVQEVIENFQTVELMSRIFTSPKVPSATRGLLISGDAGMGKTYYTMKGLYEGTDPSNIEYVKGSSITAAALYAKLFLCKDQGKVLVLDDVDIIHKSKQELMTIADLLKGATEMTSGERIIGWERARQIPMFKELGCDKPFDFQGSVVWITNDSFEDISKKLKGHWHAISSRFTQIPIRLEEHEKLSYSLYLAEEVGLLTYNCEVKDGGYSQEIVDTTLQYVRKKYKVFKEMSPRVLIKIADTMETYPSHWEMLIENSLIEK